MGKEIVVVNIGNNYVAIRAFRRTPCTSRLHVVLIELVLQSTYVIKYLVSFQRSWVQIPHGPYGFQLDGNHIPVSLHLGFKFRFQIVIPQYFFCKAKEKLVRIMRHIKAAFGGQLTARKINFKIQKQYGGQTWRQNSVNKTSWPWSWVPITWRAIARGTRRSDDLLQADSGRGEYHSYLSSWRQTRTENGRHVWSVSRWNRRTRATDVTYDEYLSTSKVLFTTLFPVSSIDSIVNNELIFIWFHKTGAILNYLFQEKSSRKNVNLKVDLTRLRHSQYLEFGRIGCCNKQRLSSTILGCIQQTNSHD